jgi:hypothetical protein
MMCSKVPELKWRIVEPPKYAGYPSINYYADKCTVELSREPEVPKWDKYIELIFEEVVTHETLHYVLTYLVGREASKWFDTNCWIIENIEEDKVNNVLNLFRGVEGC